MSKQYIYIERRIPATPRNKRLTDAIVAASSTGGGYIGGSGGPSYWQLVTTDADGNALAEEDQYLVPVGNYSVVSTADVVAYSKGDHDIVLPIASASALGAIRIGEGLAIGDDGVVTVTSTGSIGGVNVTGEGNVISSVSLSGDRKTITFLRGVTAITTDNYADTLDKRYLKLDGNAASATKLQTSRTLWGQSFNGTEDVSGDMIDVGSITASGLIKTASDVVAYASGNYDIVLPIASSSALGAVKVGDGLSISSDGTISVTDIGTVGSIKTNGEGNVISSVTLSGDRRTITFTRGITALTPDNYSNTLDSAYLKLSGGTISGVLYSTVTGEAPISVSSSVVCKSLNADLLDGTHKGGLFTGLSNVKSEISITIGGTSKQLVVGYSSNCGNAATATQLKTSRTLWGQSFNGTEDVSGDMIDVGSITASGLIKTASDVVAYASGNYDIVLPIASSSALGAVKVGDGLSISSDGTISVTDIGTVGSIKTNGEGNVISSVTLSGDRRTITFTRGITALTPDNYSNTLDSAYLKLSGGTISGVLYSTVTGEAPISVSSSVVCKSLNADLLDGTHKGGLFTGLSNVKSEISITIGGTSKQLVVGYSSNCGNAATATQLKTSRTLWGQSFNGTKNVSGDMTNVGSLTASGLIKTTSDIVAYASSDAPSPFKYWYPSVDTTGELTWKNDTSTTDPSPVNIKGPRGYSIKSVSVKSESKVSEGASVYNVYAESSTTNPIGTFTVYNGARGERGYKINKITQTASSSESGGTNTYAMYNEDGTLAGSFSVKNGKQGAAGDASKGGLINGLTWLKNPTSGSICYITGNAVSGYTSGSPNIWINWSPTAVASGTTCNYSYRVLKVGGKKEGTAILTVNEDNSGSFAGTYAGSSDIRLKDNIEYINNVLTAIEDIDIFKFTYKNDDGKTVHYGVSAQKVQPYFPELITLSENQEYGNTLGIKYIEFNTLMAVGGVKELYTLVKSLQNRIEELESVISTLKKSDTL